MWVETKTANSKNLQVVTKDNHNKEITKTAKKKKRGLRRHLHCFGQRLNCCKADYEKREETSKSKLNRTTLDADQNALTNCTAKLRYIKYARMSGK